MNKRLLKILESMALKKETQTSNEMMVLRNTVGGTALAISPHGDIFQEQREGYNLLPNDTSGLNYTWTVDLETGDYTFYFNITGKAGNSGINIFVKYENETSEQQIWSNKNTDYTVPNEEYNAIVLNLSQNITQLRINAFNMDSISKCMLVKGAKVEINKYNIADIAEYEQHGATPSMDFPSPIQRVVGTHNIKIQTKNLAYDIKYSNPKTQYYPSVIGSYHLKQGKYYCLSFNTENTGVLVYINSGIDKGFSRISTAYAVKCDGTRKYYIIKSLNSKKYYNINIVNQNNETSEEATGYTRSFMIEEIEGVTTDEEALKFTPTEFVEHKEHNYSLNIPEEYALYGKNDKYIKIGNDWFTYNEYARYNLYDKNWKKSSENANNSYYIIANEASNLKILGTITSSQTPNIFSNYFKAISPNQLIYSDNEGISVCFASASSNNVQIRIGIGLDSALNTEKLFNEWINSKDAYMIGELVEPTLTKITNETFIAQLEALAEAVAHDDVTIVDCETEELKPYIEVKFNTNRMDEFEKRLEKLELAKLTEGGNA